MVVLVGLVEEDRRGARGEVVPAIGFEHGAVHGGVQLAQALDVLGGLGRIVEAIVGLGHALVAGDHERGAVVVVGMAGSFEVEQTSRSPVGKGKVSKQSDGVYRRSILQRGAKNIAPKVHARRD